MRSSKSLNSVELPTLPCAIEVLLVTSTLHPWDQQDELYRQSIALLVLQPTPAIRQELRVLAASFISARASVHAVPRRVELTEWLAGLVSIDQPDAVVVLVAAGAPLNEGLQSKLADFSSKLYDHLDLKLDLLLWVSESPSPWPVGRHASICGDHQSALSAFEVFALLMAPQVFFCCDVYDLTTVVESGATCRIVYAYWLAAEQRLVLASNADARCLAECPKVIIAQTSTVALKDVKAINKATALLLPASTWCVMIDGQQLRTGFLSDTRSGLIPVLLIARVPR
jgi:hypothetical protein